MLDALKEFKQRLFERPLRESAYWLAGYLLIEIPIRAAEETVISWVREELASYLGISRPSIAAVATFLWQWVVPALGIFLVMLLYHRGNLRRASPAGATINATETPRLQDRDFLLWFMVMSAVALFVIFERQGPPIKGSVLLAEGSSPMEGSPLAISWESGSFRSNATPPQINSLTFLAKNIGSDEITLKDDYIISNVDSTKIHMTVSTPPGADFGIEDILPVPPDAWINLTASFGAGLSESAFVNKWVKFRAIIEYDDKTVRHDFNASWVMQRMTALHPEAAPHVSKRQP